MLGDMTPGKRIVIADDEADSLALLRFNLEREGFEVTEAHDGWEAVRSIRSDPPSLAILDLMMPELDGFTVCELLRQDPRTRTLPIIMLTAWGSQQSQDLGRQIGADAYLVKPCSHKDLLAAIRSLLPVPGPSASVPVPDGEVPRHTDVTLS